MIPAFHRAHSEDPDQTARMRKLIRALAGHACKINEQPRNGENTIGPDLQEEVKPASKIKTSGCASAQADQVLSCRQGDQDTDMSHSIDPTRLRYRAD